MKKAIKYICLLVIILLTSTSCSSKEIKAEPTEEIETVILPNVGISENSELTETESKTELKGDNRLSKTAFNENSLILPYGKLEYLSYSNYHKIMEDIPNEKLHEFIKALEECTLYDNQSQLLEINPSYKDETNLGAIIYFAISNDETETKLNISATQHKIFITVDEGNSDSHYYFTADENLSMKLKTKIQ